MDQTYLLVFQSNGARGFTSFTMCLAVAVRMTVAVIVTMSMPVIVAMTMICIR